MSFLVWLTEAIKTDFNLTERPDYKKFSDFFVHFHERSQINHFHQRIIKNMDLHPALIKFIGLSRRELKHYSPEARKVLKYVYRFLALLCKGFVEAQI